MEQRNPGAGTWQSLPQFDPALRTRFLHHTTHEQCRRRGRCVVVVVQSRRDRRDRRHVRWPYVIVVVVSLIVLVVRRWS